MGMFTSISSMCQSLSYILSQAPEADSIIKETALPNPGKPDKFHLFFVVFAKKYVPLQQITNYKAL